MERVPANLHGTLEMNLTAYCQRLMVFPTGQQFGASRLNFQCMLRGLTRGE